MQRVVLVGNCQLEVLSRLYRQFAVEGRRGQVVFIPGHVDPTDADREAIGTADILVEQVQDLPLKGGWAGIPTSATRVAIPLVTLAFLWPYAGQPHPHNPTPPHLPSGPYSAEAGDLYLNGMILNGVDPQSAVGRYLALDIESELNLDFLYRLSIEKQRRRDEQTGCRIADIIVEHFRDERLFLSPHHPDTRVTAALAGELFARLGASAADLGRLRQALHTTPFAKDELPIHPRVARHFGVSYLGADPRYRFMNEGRFTFAGYARRYMECRWNEALEEGLHLHSAALPSPRALALLEAGLAQTPDAAAGHAARGIVLGRSGRPVEAIAAVRRAVALDPGCAAHHAVLGAMLRDAGDTRGAEQAFRSAIAGEPSNGHFTHLLANLLRESRRLREARDLIAAALASDPDDSDLTMELGHIAQQMGNFPAAERAFRRAVDLAPDSEEAQTALADFSAAYSRVRRPPWTRDPLGSAPEAGAPQSSAAPGPSRAGSALAFR